MPDKELPNTPAEAPLFRYKSNDEIDPDELEVLRELIQMLRRITSPMQLLSLFADVIESGMPERKPAGMDANAYQDLVESNQAAMDDYNAFVLSVEDDPKAFLSAVETNIWLVNQLVAEPPKKSPYSY